MMTELKLFEVRYLGRAKTRQDGSQTAYGWSCGGWSVAITKAALCEWFGVSQRPGEAGTLYNVLVISQTATQDEIKKAYRRMAKQWHPDIAKEPDAAKQFRAIQNAYDVLRGDKRAKYDAGLALQGSLKTTTSLPQPDDEFGWRSPLRCGHILVEGTQAGRKFVACKILQWTDIYSAKGEMLVSSWVYGEDAPREDWVTL